MMNNNSAVLGEGNIGASAIIIIIIVRVDLWWCIPKEMVTSRQAAIAACTPPGDPGDRSTTAGQTPDEMSKMCRRTYGTHDH